MKRGMLVAHFNTFEMYLFAIFSLKPDEVAVLCDVVTVSSYTSRSLLRFC